MKRIVLAVVAAWILGPCAAFAQGSFAATGSMHQARDLHTATALADSSVLVAGGEDRMHVFDALNSAETYDPATGTFTSTGTMVEGRAQHTATLLGDGKVLLAGGETQACCTPNGNYGERPLTSVEIYNPATRTFTLAGHMSVPRKNFAATRLTDGRVLLTGGQTDINPFYASETAAAEIYNPATGALTVVSSMTVARYSHTSVLLPSGKVLIVGGGPATATSAELFDPLTQTFTAIASPTLYPEGRPTAFVLANGRVLLIGSTNGTNAETYDPATKTFAAAGSTLFKYGFWSAVVRLGDGRILLASDGKAELFDPATSTSVPLSYPAIGGIFPAGAALPNNKALIAGGETFVPYTFVASAAAAVFTPNFGPVANPGASFSASPGANCVATVALNGSGSTDADGDTLTYEWKEGTTTLGTTATITVSLAPGVHTISLTVTDPKGASDTKSTTVTVADTTAPSFSLPAPITIEQATPAGTVLVRAAPLVTDNCDANPTLTITGIPDGSLFPPGITNITYAVSDAAGNTGSAQTSVTVADTTKPSLQLPADMTVEASGPTGAAVTYSTSATDAATANIVVACSPQSGSTFAIGASAVQCSATDGAGNSASGSFTVTVIDHTAPAVTVPADVSAEATGSNGAVVTFTASATDVVDGATVVTCSPASGATFSLGTTMVTCSSTDAHGNTGAASFKVVVVDHTAPVLTVPANLSVNATGKNGAAVSFTATAADLVDGATAVLCTPASGSIFAVGTTSVLCSTSDRAGNQASASFTVTVQAKRPTGECDDDDDDRGRSRFGQWRDRNDHRGGSRGCGERDDRDHDGRDDRKSKDRKD